MNYQISQDILKMILALKEHCHPPHSCQRQVMKKDQGLRKLLVGHPKDSQVMHPHQIPEVDQEGGEIKLQHMKDKKHGLMNQEAGKLQHRDRKGLQQRELIVLKNSLWYHGTNGCPISGPDKSLVQRRTDRQTDNDKITF